MAGTKSRLGLAIGVTMLAGITVLGACGGPPSTIRTTTTEQTAMPRPVVSTTTSTTEQTR